MAYGIAIHVRATIKCMSMCIYVRIHTYACGVVVCMRISRYVGLLYRLAASVHIVMHVFFVACYDAKLII